MNNIEVFNHYAVSIVGLLYERFPTYMAIPLEDMTAPLLDMPPCPVNTMWNTSHVYIGPDLTWIFDRQQQDEALRNFDWQPAICEAQETLGRALSSDEIKNIKLGNGRPVSADEINRIKIWKDEYEIWSKRQDDTKHEQAILKGTIKFLVHEQIIRVHSLASKVSFAHEDIDVLIDKHYGGLKFALTWEGFSRMMRKDPLSTKGSPIYKSVVAYAADKGVDVAAAAATTSGLVPLLLGAG